MSFDIPDRYKDRFLSRQEFGNTPTQHFDLLDKNKDGKQYREEYKAGFALMDIDRDGMIDKKKLYMAARSASVFHILDGDGDGKITRNEYNAGFNILDANGYGVITREELNCASGAPFAALDKDGDGVISGKDLADGFEYFDPDKDGFITATGFNTVAHPGFVFDALDRDGDGLITSATPCGPASTRQKRTDVCADCGAGKYSGDRSAVLHRLRRWQMRGRRS